MTKPWTMNNAWAGETVAVLGAGPSLTAAAVESVRQYRTIAANDAHLMGADMLVALDGNWPQAFREFAGIRVTGCPDDSLDAMFAGSMYERITLAPGHVVEIRNSGLAAIRIAARLGVKKIILLGFDPETSAHFNDGAGAGDPYPHLAAGLAQVIADLTAAGIEVERCISGDGSGEALPPVSDRLRRGKVSK